MSSNSIYYVYRYNREDGTPYYIGKGTRRRAYRKGSPPKERIEIISEGLTEQDALALEVELIAKYGRKDLGTGILRNLTDGGEGTSGRKFSEESKAKISAAARGRRAHNKGKPLSDKHKANISAAKTGKKLSEETKAKIRAAMTGKKLSEETKSKMSAAHKGRKLKDV